MQISSEPLRERAVSSPASAPVCPLASAGAIRRSLSESDLGRRTQASPPLSFLSTVYGEAAENARRAAAGPVGNQARENGHATECRAVCVRPPGQCIPAEPRENGGVPAGEEPDDDEWSWPGGDAEGSHWSEDERAWQNATFDMMRAQQQHVQQLLNMMREHVRALVENAQKQIIDEQQDRLRLMRETADTLGRAAAA